MEEPGLPPSSQATQLQPRPSFLLTRKRTHSDYEDETTASSDPATFSSDETAPGTENYAPGKRKKRVFKGSWWDKHPAKSGKKREFRRNFDSGIFMGSESEEQLSSDSFTMEDEFLRDQQNATQTRQLTPPPKLWSVQDSEATPRAKLSIRNSVRMSEEHEAVCNIVKRCLELGKEGVDLSQVSALKF